jgi:hypothetical protein
MQQFNTGIHSSNHIKEIQKKKTHNSFTDKEYIYKIKERGYDDSINCLQLDL